MNGIGINKSCDGSKTYESMKKKQGMFSSFLTELGSAIDSNLGVLFPKMSAEDRRELREAGPQGLVNQLVAESLAQNDGNAMNMNIDMDNVVEQLMQQLFPDSSEQERGDMLANAACQLFNDNILDVSNQIEARSAREIQFSLCGAGSGSGSNINVVTSGDIDTALENTRLDF